MSSSDVFVENHSRLFILPAPDTLNPVEDVQIDSYGNIWAAVYVDYLVTEGGVCVHNGSFWTQYEVADGLAGPVVRRMVIDANDDVWVATSTGVSKISSIPFSISEEVTNAGFVAYPNPATDVLTVQFVEPNSGDKSIEVYSTTMQLVDVQTVPSGQAHTSLSVSDYNAGVYFVMVNGNATRVVVR
jgi:hypothetical protein